MNRSQEIFDKACNFLPGGVSRNTIFRRPHPVYADHGSGCYVTDVDGVRRIDFANNMASLIHGHSHPQIVKAVTEQLQKGSAFTMATVVESEFAQLLCQRIPSFDKIRFVNSGTEAVMVAIKAARCFTGRPKIAKVEGAYHGTYDYAEASQISTPDNWGPDDRPSSVPVAAGTPSSALEDVVILPFNDIVRSRTILDQQASEIACILLDPLPHRVGLIQASPDYVEFLREWADKNGALLVLDEVITFRSGYAGASEWFDVQPDLTALGKIIGGGFPVGAFGGRGEIMELLDPTREQIPLPHSGTFSANPITMTAGKTAMELFDKGTVARLNQLGEYARNKISEAIKIADYPASVTGAGSLFRVHVKPEPPTDYRSTYMNHQERQKISALVNHLFDNGFMLINTCSAALSTVMQEEHVDQLAAAMVDGFAKLKQL